MNKRESETGPSQRNLSNVKLTESFRHRYLTLWVVLGVAQLVMVDVLLFELYKDRVVRMGLDEGLFGMSAMLPQTLLAIILVVHAIVLALGMLFLGILTVHRIAGPHIAIKRTCNAIADGQVSEQLRFRKADGLDDVADAFNKMTAALRRNAGRTQESESPQLRVVGE